VGYSMSAGQNPWGVLSDMIQRKVGESRQRKQKMEDEARQNQMDIIMGGVQAHAQNGTLTDEMIQQSQEQMQKLVPKESIPVIEGWHKLMGVISRKKRGQKTQQLTQPGQTSQQGQQGQQTAQPQAQAAPQQAPTAPGSQSPTPPAAGAPQAKPSQMYPTATEMGTSAGQFAAAQEAPLRQARESAAEGLRKRYAAQGQQMPKELGEALDMWAIGAPTTAINGLMRHNLHPVVVKGPNNSRLPAVQNLQTGEVIGPDGETIDNPEIMPSSGAKPRIGWGKDKQGFFSFAVDPFTNQPIPNTEDRSALPPSQYMDKVRVGHYFYTDDSGGVHEIPNVTTSGVSAPATRTGGAGLGAGSGAGTSTGTSATVPPGMRGPAVRPKTAVGAGAGKPAKSDIVGTKDTGILSPPAIKVITTTQPVLDQVDRLLGDIDRLKLGDNNSSGYLFTSRLKYSMGKASPEGTLANDIAGLSLGSVVEAASALQGSSRSIQALKKALVHTPNPWVDSPKLIREKLQTIKDRLNDVVEDANKYGRKRQPSTAGPASSTVPPGMRAPAKQADPLGILQ
jgi:hypothetical protein